MPRSGNDVVVIMWRDSRRRSTVRSGGAPRSSVGQVKRATNTSAKQDLHRPEDVARAPVQRPFDGDVQEAAQAEADRLEAEYSVERLGSLAFAGGWEQQQEET